MESLLDEIESQHASQRRPGPPLDGADVSSSGVKRKRSHRDDEERFSREREEEHEGSMEGDRVDRTAQACIRCRKLKAKCINAANPPCDRCKRTGTECEFIPRANASTFEPAAFPSAHCTDAWRADISARVQDLERQNRALLTAMEQMARVGESQPPLSAERPALVKAASTPLVHPAIHPRASEMRAPIDPGKASTASRPRLENREGVLAACRTLVAGAGEHQQSRAWSDEVVEALWLSFQERMPGLHFFQEPMSFTHPSPLLAAAILHVAAAHYPSPELAAYQPVYLQAGYRAISALAIPTSFGAAPARPLGRTDKFDNVLGIVLIGLTTLGWIDGVGTWVSMAYRLLLDGLAEEDGRRVQDWRGLWEGLRTIELEHCSLHLIAPVLPRSPPDSLKPVTKKSSARDASAMPAISDLILLMQDKLSVFTGRGIPSVWQTIIAQDSGQLLPPIARSSAVAHDMATIDKWAQELDAWHARYGPIIRRSTLYVRSIVLLNYHLHKLFVLSIFYPLRKMTLGDKHQRADDRKELLASSRIVLQLQSAAMEIWSNWDLVMLTSASLIVLDAVQAGQGQFEDLKLVQTHMNSLRVTKQPPPSLRHMLARRLEDAMQSARTPPAPPPPPAAAQVTMTIAEFTPPDQAIPADMTWWESTPFQTGIATSLSDTWQGLAPASMYGNGVGSWDFQQAGDGEIDLSQDWPPAILNWFGQAGVMGDGRS